MKNGCFEEETIVCEGLEKKRRAQLFPEPIQQDHSKKERKDSLGIAPSNSPGER